MASSYSFFDVSDSSGKAYILHISYEIINGNNGGKIVSITNIQAMTKSSRVIGVSLYLNGDIKVNGTVLAHLSDITNQANNSVKFNNYWRYFQLEINTDITDAPIKAFPWVSNELFTNDIIFNVDLTIKDLSYSYGDANNDYQLSITTGESGYAVSENQLGDLQKVSQISSYGIGDAVSFSEYPLSDKNFDMFSVESTATYAGTLNSNTDNGIGFYVSCLRLTTLDFKGKSTKLIFHSTFNVLGSRDSELRWALCSSDENTGLYFGNDAASNGVSNTQDIYQLDSGSFSLSVPSLSGDESYVDIVIEMESDKIQPNTIYYLFIYSARVITFTNGGVIEPTITLELIYEIDGCIYLGNNTSFDGYLVYIGNGTSFDTYIPYIGDGTSWNALG